MVRIGAVIVGTATFVGIVTFRNTPEVSVVTAVPTQTELTQPAKPETAIASEPITDPIKDATTSTLPLIGDFGFSSGSPNQLIETPPAIKTKESLTAATPEATPSPAPPAVSAASRPSP